MGRQVTRRSFLNGFSADPSLLLDLQKKVDNDKINTYMLKGVQNERDLAIYRHHCHLVYFAGIHPAQNGHFHLTARFLSGDKQP